VEPYALNIFREGVLCCVGIFQGSGYLLPGGAGGLPWTIFHRPPPTPLTRSPPTTFFEKSAI